MDVCSEDPVAAFQRGELDQARRLAQSQLATDPGSARLRHLHGIDRVPVGQAREGIGWLRRASDAEPDNVGYRVMLARALVDSGKADEALHLPIRSPRRVRPSSPYGTRGRKLRTARGSPTWRRRRGGCSPWQGRVIGAHGQIWARRWDGSNDGQTRQRLCAAHGS